jgi:hypothetical protein
MTTNEIEKAVFEAFVKALQQMGPRANGLSCLVKNWRVPSSQGEQKQAA